MYRPQRQPAPSHRRASSSSRRHSEIDTNLAHDEIIIAIELPTKGLLAPTPILRSGIVCPTPSRCSVAVGLELEGGAIKEARIALGGVSE